MNGEWLGLDVDQWLLVLSGGQILLILFAILLVRRILVKAELLPLIMEEVEEDGESSTGL